MRVPATVTFAPGAVPAAARSSEREQAAARTSSRMPGPTALLPEAWLIRALRPLDHPQALQRASAGVPAQDGVVVAGLAQLLRPLERLHGRAQRLIRHR